MNVEREHKRIIPEIGGGADERIHFVVGLFVIWNERGLRLPRHMELAVIFADDVVLLAAGLIDKHRVLFLRIGAVHQHHDALIALRTFLDRHKERHQTHSKLQNCQNTADF